MTDLYDYHNGPNLGLEPPAAPKASAEESTKGADVALPHPLGIVDPDPTAPRVYTVQDLANYARAAVLADRQQRGGDVVSAFDAAVAAELPKVSTLEYNSHEICKHFAERVRAALAAQPAANPEPSDEEIDAIAASMPDGAGGMLKQWGYRQFARALLARYGQPAASAGPVAYAAFADNGNIRIWSREPLNAPGCVPLYAAPTAAQAQAGDADALDAARYRWLRKGESDAVAVVRGLGSMDYGGSAVVYTHSEEIDGDDLDAAIDAAMREEGSND